MATEEDDVSKTPLLADIPVRSGDAVRRAASWEAAYAELIRARTVPDCGRDAGHIFRRFVVKAIRSNSPVG